MFAAFTMASTSRVVMSACTASTPGMGIARFWSTNPVAAGHWAHRRENVNMRLFVAVWPPDEVIELISGLERPELPALRWTVRPQWHVTLRFLGEVDDVDLVSDALGLLAGSGAEHAVLGPSTAWFPGRRVLQVPVSGLENLSERVNRSDVRPRPGPEVCRRRRRAVPGPSHHCESSRAGSGRRCPGCSTGWDACQRRVDGHRRLSLVLSSLSPDGPVYSEVSKVELADSR